MITFVTTWPTLDKAKDSRVATLQRSGIAAQSSPLSLGFMKLERKDLGQMNTFSGVGYVQLSPFVQLLLEYNITTLLCLRKDNTFTFFMLMQFSWCLHFTFSQLSGYILLAYPVDMIFQPGFVTLSVDAVRESPYRHSSSGRHVLTC